MKSSIEIRELTQEQLVQLIAAAKQALYPEAIVKDGELECVACQQRGIPALVEDGMVVTHNLEDLSASRISARGWDGNSSGVSEEGELLLLECPHCFQWHRIPESADLEWL